MKKITYLILMVICTSACSLPSYNLKSAYNATSIDFSEGTWILNTMDVSYGVLNKIEPKLLGEFSSSLNERFIYYPETTDIMIPRNIGMDLSQKQLKEIKELTGFDYFINVKGGVLKSDLGSISFSKRDDYIRSNSSFMEMEVYDLNNQSVIYSQRVTGTASREKDNDDVHFSKTSEEILIKCFDKLLNDFRTKIVKKQV